LKGEIPGFADISVKTIQHMCQKRLGMPSQCTTEKPLLTAMMVKKRLAFYKNNDPGWKRLGFHHVL
jgi:hypothetical protein